MKKLMIVAALFAAQAQADCKNVEVIAKSIMEARQAGVAASEIVQIIDSEMAGQPKMQKAAKVLLVEAYKKPRFDVESYQLQAVNDFSNEWYIMCLQQTASKQI